MLLLLAKCSGYKKLSKEGSRGHMPPVSTEARSLVLLPFDRHGQLISGWTFVLSTLSALSKGEKIMKTHLAKCLEIADYCDLQGASRVIKFLFIN